MKSRRQEDYLFFFAIRTILSLDIHRRVWLQKERAAIQCEGKEHKLLLFNLHPVMMGISDTYYIYIGNKELRASEILASTGKEDEITDNWASKDAALADSILSYRGNRLSLNYMQILNLFLCLGAPPVRQFISDAPDHNALKSQQRTLYYAQETAIFVAANWEVQRRLLVDWDTIHVQQSGVQRGESEKVNNTAAIIRAIFAKMDTELQNMNEKTFCSIDPPKSMGDAFRALLLGNVIDDLDFEAFYDTLCSFLRTED